MSTTLIPLLGKGGVRGGSVNIRIDLSGSARKLIEPPLTPLTPPLPRRGISRPSTFAALVFVLIFLVSCSKPLPVFYTVPDFKLTERSSREVSRQELAGKVWIADFIFTHCAGTCPVMTGKMRRLQDTLPAEIQLVSFSVDPAQDTPEVLKEYAERYGADAKRWLFLTGDKEAIYKLSIDGFKLGLDDAGGSVAEPITHSTRFALVDRQGRIRGYYGMDDEAALDRLTQDVKSLL